MDRFLSRATVTTTVRAMVTMTTTATTPPTIAAVLSDWRAHVLSVESGCEGRSETSYTHIEYSLGNVIYYPHSCAVMCRGTKVTCYITIFCRV